MPDSQSHPDRNLATLLAAAQRGDADASASLFAVTYDELRRLAGRVRLGRASETLNTTALVHEAYLKLADGVPAESRAHFLALAAKAMRHILVDEARRRSADKRGGGAERIELRETLHGTMPETDLLGLDRALDRLAAVDERAARVVECRFFGGLTVEETAAALDLSPRTVERSWRAARVRLFRDLHDDPPA
ncbi:MAG: ECF-type sigma factor [Bacteroidota bacterium]